MRTKEGRMKALAVIQALMIVSVSFALCVSMDAEALDFIDATSIAVPWTSSFTPSDSAWDSTGNHCVVVGNDTSDIQSSAWYYNDQTNTWKEMAEGSDPGIAPVNLVKNMNFGVTYPTIQAAVFAANPGDTLHVWAGTYNENVIVNKQLTIRGNGSANTIIRGGASGAVVNITAGGVSLQGFNITGAVTRVGVMLYQVSDCRIENNTLYGNLEGVRLDGASNNVIKNNGIKGNSVGVRTSSIGGSKTLVGTTESGGALDTGTLFDMDVSGSDFRILHDFKVGYVDGRNPYYSQFVQSGSLLYGTTSTGGGYNRGTVFVTDKSGTPHTVLHHFKGGISDGLTPNGPVIQDGAAIYGMTTSGGTSNLGTLFKMNMDGSGFSILHSFTGTPDGRAPYGGLTQVGGTLYGMTSSGGASGLGSVFKINTDGTGYAVLMSFTGTAGLTPGSSPYGSLLHSGGFLYGMTYSGGASNLGTVFKVRTDGTGYSLMQTLTGAANGQYPRGSLILDVIDGITLYGMTYSGGASNLGLIFRIRTDGTNYYRMFSFSGAATGQYPYGSLVQDATALYGMTYNGGASNLGTVFRITKDAVSYNLLASFNGVAYGQNPRGSLFYDGSMLYGMTYSGGTFTSGTAFKLTTDGSTFQTFHHFTTEKHDGTFPLGNVVLGSDGSTLYGMTASGGNSGYGTVYKIRTDGTDFAVMHNFTGLPDGGSPYANLTLSGNTLFGTTYYGGASDSGTVFRMNTDGSGYMKLHDFVGGNTDGANPYGNLLLNGNLLFGMTRAGGMNGMGTIFSIHKDLGTFNLLHVFMGGALDGQGPWGGLITDGSYLYGMTYQGGASNAGLVFRINPDGSGFTIMYDMNVVNGYYPYGNLVLDGSMLYGLTNRGGIDDYGAIFSIDKDTFGYTLMHSLSYSDGIVSRGSLLLDDSLLYGMTNSGGTYDYGTIFSIDKDTYDFTVLRNFAGYPTESGWPTYHNDLIMLEVAGTFSAGNEIYHNNFVTNAMHARDDSGPNTWHNGLPSGGNFWSGFVAGDAEPDNIGDDPYMIPGTALTEDPFPWLKATGWFRASFESVAWDDVHQRFWICGESSPDSRSSCYYVPVITPSLMVPVPGAAPISFSALAVDDIGNVLLGGNDLFCVVYYNIADDNGYAFGEAGTGGMYGWNITGITFNQNDDRFYLVGNVDGMDLGVAFITDQIPLTVASNCYIDTSDFMNLPGIGGLRSIAWNPSTNYALAVGDGVYRLDPYDGNPGHELTWSIVGSPLAGIEYHDVSWDSNGWNEAGISGTDGTWGTYWRYYNTNPHVIPGYTSTVTDRYGTCAMKPPASPKWLFLLGRDEGVRINILEKDESGTLSFTGNMPHAFNVRMWKQTDPLRTNLLDVQVDAGSTYTFFIEGNYTMSGVDYWNDLKINITAWFDDGVSGNPSQPGDLSWSNPNYRTRQFNLSYDAASDTRAVLYPAPVGVPPVREFFIASHWRDPLAYGIDGKTHRLYINVTFGAQTYVAPGDGAFDAPGPNLTDKNQALNDIFSWDMKLRMEDKHNPGNFNVTYGEFGMKSYASISSSGNPTGSAPPGSMNYHLTTPCTIYYSSNTQYYVTVAVPDLHFGGNPVDPRLIPAANLQVENLHSLAVITSSDIYNPTYFTAADTPLYVWGLSSGTPLPTPLHGTASAGPSYTDYSGAISSPFELTMVDWWVDVPTGISQGTYRGTITITITD